VLVDSVGAPVTIGVAGIILSAFIAGITIFSPHVRRREDSVAIPAFSD
jgi:hypothetical protein